jgi:hypothetical protein
VSKLEKFISRNTVTGTESLPLVHTTRSYSIEQIKETNNISTHKCNIFDENLVYLFVGRPAYRRNKSGAQAEYWELPCCFIFDSEKNIAAKRIFPFDSGAFKSGLYPEYIKFMDIVNFEATRSDAPERIISAIFGTRERYFGGKSKSEEDFCNEFQLGPLDAEIKALRKLADDGTTTNFDDRRFTIEVQSTSSIDFAINPPDAVVIPAVYLEDIDIRKKIIDDWKATPLTYEVNSLSLELYDGIVFQRVADYYRSKGYI